MALAANPGKVYLKAGSGTPSSGDECKGINKNSIKFNGEQLDVTDFKDTSAWRLFLQGLKNGTIELSGFVEVADSPQGLLLSNYFAGTTLYCWVEMNPSGSTGAKGFQAVCQVESYTQEAEVGGLVAFSSTLRVTGAIAVDS